MSERACATSDAMSLLIACRPSAARGTQAAVARRRAPGRIVFRLRAASDRAAADEGDLAAAATAPGASPSNGADESPTEVSEPSLGGGGRMPTRRSRRSRCSAHRAASAPHATRTRRERADAAREAAATA